MTRTLECSKCGAALERAGAASGWVKCDYCGTETDVGRPQREITPKPPPEPRPRPAPEPAESKVVAKIASALGTLVVIGVSVAVYVYSFHSSSTHRRTGSRPAGAGETRALVVRGAPACMFATKGDDILDPATLVRLVSAEDSAKRQVRIFDGVTGKPLWRGPLISKDQRPRLFCLGRRWLGVQFPDHRVQIVSAKAPHTGPVIALRDKVRRVAADDRCVRLLTDDGSAAGFDPETGQATACAARPLRRSRHRPGATPSGRERRFTGAGSTFRVAARRRGTPMLTATCRQGARRLWLRELNLKATRFGIPALLTARTLAVIGAAHPQKGEAHLVGLDRATGVKRFEVTLPGSSIATFGAALSWNGRFLVVASSDGVIAFDPRSGRKAWQLQ